MISLNDRAVKTVQRLTEAAECFGVAVTRLANGAEVVDAGVDVPGSLDAGRLVALACLGDLGEVRISALHIGDLVLPGVEVTVDVPVVACMAGQYAGWAVKVSADESHGSYFAMGSGPARALYRGDPVSADVDYRDTSSQAVLVLETRTLPGVRETEWIAEKCGVEPGGLHVLVAPTASLVGSVQVAARIVETGLHKMHEIGYDMGTVRSGFGTCPLAPLAADDLKAIGRTNDAVLYGGRAWYTVEDDDARLEEVITQLPSSSSRDYGASFGELFERYGGDFYKMDPLLFSPAEITLSNSVSGRSFHAGRVDPETIAKTLFG